MRTEGVDEHNINIKQMNVGLKLVVQRRHYINGWHELIIR